MGEIRVQVRLTNAMDDALVRRSELSADQVRRVETDAMVDTGAVRSVIPAALLNQLGVQTRRQDFGIACFRPKSCDSGYDSYWRRSGIHVCQRFVAGPTDVPQRI